MLIPGDVPMWLREMPDDGLFGDVEAFLVYIESAQCLQDHLRLLAANRMLFEQAGDDPPSVADPSARSAQPGLVP